MSERDRDETRCRELPSAIREALAEETERVLDDCDFGLFAKQLHTRLAAETERALEDEAFVPVAAALLEDAETELSRRQGQWSAFTAGVLREAGAEERLAIKTPVPEQAIAAFRRRVEAELEEVEPKFEREFHAGVERKLRSPAPRGSWIAWIREMASAFFELEPRRIALGSASFAFALAIIAIFVIAPRAPQERTRPLNPIARGEVSLDELSFEGQVTVMNGDGVTVLWLAQGPS